MAVAPRTRPTFPGKSVPKSFCHRWIRSPHRWRRGRQMRIPLPQPRQSLSRDRHPCRCKWWKPLWLRLAGAAEGGATNDGAARPHETEGQAQPVHSEVVGDVGDESVARLPPHPGPFPWARVKSPPTHQKTTIPVTAWFQVHGKGRMVHRFTWRPTRGDRGMSQRYKIPSGRAPPTTLGCTGRQLTVDRWFDKG